jgi:hypothetical protein
MLTKIVYTLLFVGMMAIFPSVGFSDTEKEMEEVKGKIVEINVAANTIRLEPGILGTEKDLQVTPSTKIVVKGKPGTLDQLRKGDEVKVNYAEGKGEFRTAEYIEVMG